MSPRTQARTRGRRPPAVRSHRRSDVEQTIARLLVLLNRGDLDGAHARLQAARGVERALARMAVTDPLALTGASVVGEIRLAFGEVGEARSALSRLAAMSRTELLATLTPRQVLQLAECEYAMAADPQPAIDIATEVLAHAERRHDLPGAAECLFYLARFELRKSDHEQANLHCMRGLEMLHRAGLKGSQSAGLQWQTGRMLRVRGTALWWQGRVAEATAVLYLAAWVLRQTKGARLHLGDALHALGRLLRSQGSERYADAKAALEEASASYEDHELKRARTLIDLARVELNMGLRQVRADDGRDGPATISPEASELFGKADGCIRDALKLSDRYCQAEPIMPVWRRQHIDGLVWSSWFRQEAVGYIDVEQAAGSARSAATMARAIPNTPEAIEAALACGTCEMSVGNSEAARHHMTQAVEWLSRVRIPKLHVQAHLCLAQLESRAGNLPGAGEHLDAARAVFNTHEFLSHYLSGRLAEVEREVKATAPIGRLMLSLDEVLDRPAPPNWKRIKVVRCLAEAWALEAAIESSGGVRRKGRDRLGIGEATDKEIRKRFAQLEDCRAKARRDAKVSNDKG